MAAFTSDTGQCVRRGPVDESTGFTEANRMAAQTGGIRVLSDGLESVQGARVHCLGPVLVGSRVAGDACLRTNVLAGQTAVALARIDSLVAVGIGRRLRATGGQVEADADEKNSRDE